jgi:hypothetical protein
MLERLDSQIDVQVWPVQVMGTWQAHLRQLANSSVTKPWELLEWHEILALLHEYPEALK